MEKELIVPCVLGFFKEPLLLDYFSEDMPDDASSNYNFIFSK